MKRELKPKMLYFGTPVVLVSSLNSDGSANIAPISSAWWVGHTAMLGLSVNSQTVRNLQHRPGWCSTLPTRRWSTQSTGWHC